MVQFAAIQNTFELCLPLIQSGVLSLVTEKYAIAPVTATRPALHTSLVGTHHPPRAIKIAPTGIRKPFPAIALYIGIIDQNSALAYSSIG